MTFVKYIYARLFVAVMLMASLALPVSSADVSHGCCPPDEAAGAMMMSHMMDRDQQEDSETGPASEAPCDFSCCGVITSVAVPCEQDASPIVWQIDTQVALSAATRVQSVVAQILTPPPKHI